MTCIIKFFIRCFCLTNHKDIGALYLIFSAFSGVIGTVMFVIIRMLLAYTVVHFLSGNNQLYNVFIIAHGFVLFYLLYRFVHIPFSYTLRLPIFFLNNSIANILVFKETKSLTKLSVISKDSVGIPKTALTNPTKKLYNKFLSKVINPYITIKNKNNTKISLITLMTPLVTYKNLFIFLIGLMAGLGSIYVYMESRDFSVILDGDTTFSCINNPNTIVIKNVLEELPDASSIKNAFTTIDASSMNFCKTILDTILETVLTKQVSTKGLVLPEPLEGSRSFKTLIQVLHIYLMSQLDINDPNASRDYITNIYVEQLKAYILAYTRTNEDKFGPISMTLDSTLDWLLLSIAPMTVYDSTALNLLNIAYWEQIDFLYSIFKKTLGPFKSIQKIENFNEFNQKVIASLNNSKVTLDTFFNVLMEYEAYFGESNGSLYTKSYILELVKILNQNRCFRMTPLLGFDSTIDEIAHQYLYIRKGDTVLSDFIKESREWKLCRMRLHHFNSFVQGTREQWVHLNHPELVRPLYAFIYKW